jgi:small subunit ribosomal protein S1
MTYYIVYDVFISKLGLHGGELTVYSAIYSAVAHFNGNISISQICQKRIRKPSEVLSVGDMVKVKVLNTNDGKISLSIKAVEEEREAEEMESLEAQEYSSDESVGTSLGDLFAKLNL